MNRALFVIMTIVCFVSFLSAESLRLLEQESIFKKAAEIGAQMQRKRYIAATIVVGGVIGLLSGLTIVEGDESTGNLFSGFFNLLRGGFGHCAASFRDLFITSDGRWYMVNTGAYWAGTICSAVVAGQLAKRVWHPDTLRWYVANHVPYAMTIESMKEALQDCSITPEQYDQMDDFLRATLSRLTRHTEFLCAYMIYKSTILLPEDAIEARTVSAWFFNYHNTWLQAINNHMKQHNYSALYESVVAYAKEVKIVCKRFATIEGETLEERRAIELS